MTCNHYIKHISWPSLTANLLFELVAKQFTSCQRYEVPKHLMNIANESKARSCGGSCELRTHVQYTRKYIIYNNSPTIALCANTWYQIASIIFAGVLVFLCLCYGLTIHLKSVITMNFVESSCFVCTEIYDDRKRKPLLLPCSHSFCQRCLEKMEEKNNKVCPVCRNAWSQHSVNLLVYIRQLVPDANKTIHEKESKTVSHSNDCCESHWTNMAFWCNSCKISLCKHVWQKKHKECDWVFIEEKIKELKKVLKERTESTQRRFNDFFTCAERENNARLSNIQDLIKQLKKYEKALLSLKKSISTEKKNYMYLLKKFDSMSFDENMSFTVEEYISAISVSTPFLDRLIEYPKISKFSLLAESEETASTASVSELSDDWKYITEKKMKKVNIICTNMSNGIVL